MTYRCRAAGHELQLEPVEGLRVVRFSEPSARGDRAGLAARAGFDFEAGLEVPYERFTVLRQRAAASATDASGCRPPAGIARIGPVYRHGAATLFASDRVLIGLHDPDAPVAPLLQGLSCRRWRARGHGEFVIQLSDDTDPLTVVARLAAHPQLRYAEPDFVTLVPRLQPRPLGAAVATPGAADFRVVLDAVNARAAALEAIDGAPTVVAVLDEGVDTGHPDLQSAALPGHDTIDGDTNQQPKSWNGHGTACAGLAVADGGGGGVRGVGAGCKLLPIRIASSAQPGAAWSWSIRQAADGIDWAWTHGADVLNNSWGGCPPSEAIAAAFERALTRGRGGRGCVAVVAAGNGGGAVEYPATLPGVLAVSATNRHDELKTFTSADGDGSWASNVGPAVGIVAPGVGNLTTDIEGPNGYTGSSYVAFSGTSAAAPLVAGAAGQILRRHATLTAGEVIALLTDSARKVGALPYPGGRNDQFGHGRLDVGAALALAAVRHPGPG